MKIKTPVLALLNILVCHTSCNSIAETNSKVTANKSDTTAEYIKHKKLEHQIIVRRDAILYDQSFSFSQAQVDSMTKDLLDLYRHTYETSNRAGICELGIAVVNATDDYIIRYVYHPLLPMPSAPAVNLDNPLAELSKIPPLNLKQLRNFNDSVQSANEKNYSDFLKQIYTVTSAKSTRSGIAYKLERIALFMNEPTYEKSTISSCLRTFICATDFQNNIGKLDTYTLPATHIIIVGAPKRKALKYLNSSFEIIAVENLSSAIRYALILKQ